MDAAVWSLVCLSKHSVLEADTALHLMWAPQTTSILCRSTAICDARKRDAGALASINLYEGARHDFFLKPTALMLATPTLTRAVF